jgi:hypothetical protein
MTVYVDDMKAAFQPKHRPGRTYVMCHMIADTDAELHAMADRIGVLRKWHQGDHYDITQAKRALAVRYGAREITLRQLAMMAMNRRRGEPLGTPEEAETKLRERGFATKQPPTLASYPAAVPTSPAESDSASVYPRSPGYPQACE